MPLWIELHPSPNSYVEALTPSVTVFRDGAFGGRAKWGRMGEILTQQDRWPNKIKRRKSSFSRSTCICQGKWYEHRERKLWSASQEELSLGPNPAGTLISNFQPPELWENSFLLIEHSAYGILPNPDAK